MNYCEDKEYLITQFDKMASLFRESILNRTVLSVETEINVGWDFSSLRIMIGTSPEEEQMYEESETTFPDGRKMKVMMFPATAE